MTACGTPENSSPGRYFAKPVPPRKQEFRWSNGRLPRSFDPAKAVAPPETDIVRAIFEGLTRTDPKTLDAIPAVAERWSVSDDNRVWTFQLRKNAKWTNERPLTARDFIRAWDRLARLGEDSAHPELIANFARITKSKPAAEGPTIEAGRSPSGELRFEANSNGSASGHPITTDEINNTTAELSAETLAVEALGSYVLKITLATPDPDLPKLLAHPVFSPIFGDGSEFNESAAPTSLVTNGPFRIVQTGREGIVLARSESYRDAGSVRLDWVRFVPSGSPDEALAAYRAGGLDAITNTEFEPLALKLLAPYEDFRRATHAAVNLYEFNRLMPPYSDRRVREALSIAIERERLSESELEGATHPAFRYLPFGQKDVTSIIQDNERAQNLLTAAGFPNGDGFPPVRLVINRNDTQLRVARAVARMWKQNLGIDTNILVKESSELPNVRSTNNFDLIRRGVVFPTSNTKANLSAVIAGRTDVEETGHANVAGVNTNTISRSVGNSNASAGPGLTPTPKVNLVPSEAQALFNFPSIPLYFPTSFSLVKPYVLGFEPNNLDVLILNDIQIDNDWQPQ